METDKREWLVKGIVERVTVGGYFIKFEKNGKKVQIPHECPDHIEAIRLIVDTLTEGEHKIMDDIRAIKAVGHRVVHGAEKFASSARINDEMLRTIEECAVLAPLHNPPNIQGIKAAMQVLPDIPHVAVFDTAFHQTMPEYAYMYPLPREWYEKYRVRRYGFHGTSHLYVSKRAAMLLRKPLPETKIITLHIGNGVSFAAVKGGISVDTSMGFTPLEGAVMGTRCGDIDPAIPLYIMQKENISAKDMDTILNKKSGVFGITGRFTDRRDIEMEAKNWNKQCQLSIEIETYRIKKYIGAYAAAMGGLDAVVFTAGVGENGALYREKAMEGLEFLGIKIDREKNAKVFGGATEEVISAPDSKVKVFVIPTDEELVIVEDTLAILKGTYKDHLHFEYSFTKPDFVRKK